MSAPDKRIWVGIDAGKGHHWAVAVDTVGESVFSTKVINDEAQILTLIETARERAEEVRWAVDISGRASTLLLALLIAHGQHVVYVPGRTVNRMSGAYRGEGKTDAKDARVIADQARMRPKGFARLNTPPELVTTLQVLTNGMGPILGAEFVAIVGDLSGYLDAGRLASHAGLAPVARDSGRRTGNYHRPKRYHRRLRYIFYMAAQTAMMRPGPSRDYYLKKRSEGLLHTQALLSLARRRVDVLWAMLRDKRLFTSAPPVTQAT